MPADCGFADNALNRVKELLALVWGEENIIPTINFVEDGLDKPLETYMIRDFWKEHCKRYQNRPIYWLFSSPSGAFQVLVYMHRMSRHTVEQIRSRYLLRYIGSLDSRIQNMRERENELTTAERRVLERLQRDIQECREYEMQLRTVADSQIEFDLDDGVKVNYEKFEEVVRRI